MYSNECIVCFVPDKCFFRPCISYFVIPEHVFLCFVSGKCYPIACIVCLVPDKCNFQGCVGYFVSAKCRPRA